MRRVEWTIICVAIVIIALLARGWYLGRADRLTLLRNVTEKQKAIDAASAREKEAADGLQQKLREIETLKRRVQSPAEAARELPAALSNLPLPITIDLPDAKAVSHTAAANRPDVNQADSSALEQRRDTAAEIGSASTWRTSLPAIATIPQADLKPLFDAVQNCHACQVQITALRTELDSERLKSIAIGTQRDAAIAAAKGGSRWSRVKRAAEWFAIGAVAGGVVATHRGT